MLCQKTFFLLSLVRKLPHYGPTLQTSSDQLGRAKACLLLRSSLIGASKAASRIKQSIPTMASQLLSRCIKAQECRSNNLQVHVSREPNLSIQRLKPFTTATLPKHGTRRRWETKPTPFPAKRLKCANEPAFPILPTWVTTRIARPNRELIHVYTPKLACHQFVAWMHRQTPRCQSTSGRPQSASGIKAYLVRLNVA